MEELTYTQADGCYIPALVLDEPPAHDIFYGKYGSLRRDRLREHRPALWAALAANCPTIRMKLGRPAN